jgi:hypothetical protein
VRGGEKVNTNSKLAQFILFKFDFSNLTLDFKDRTLSHGRFYFQIFLLMVSNRALMCNANRPRRGLMFIAKAISHHLDLVEVAHRWDMHDFYKYSTALRSLCLGEPGLL